MPVYSYEAVDASGRKIRESVSFSDEAALKTSLREKGLIPLSIKASEARGAAVFERITTKDLLVFTQELGNLLDSGLPIDRALYVLSEHAEKKAFRLIIREVYVDIQKGGSLSGAMSRHKVFPTIYVNMIRAGEAGGILDTVIKRIVSFLEITLSLKKEITSALIYPLLLVFVGGLAVIILMVKVIPNFARIFSDMGQALPLPTLMLLRISDVISSYWWAGLSGTFILFVLIRGYIRTAEGKLFVDGLKLRTPVVRQLVMKMIVSRFARTFGTLLQSGVPILDAVKISRDVIDNEILSKRLAVIEDGISKGRGMAAPLKECGVFPAIVTQMVMVGEEGGRLEETFLLIAERFEVETKDLIKRFVSLFEPLLILIMGLVVGFIVIAMLVGIFSINEIPI